MIPQSTVDQQQLFTLNHSALRDPKHSLGFKEYMRDKSKRIKVMDWMIDDAVSRLDGVPGC